MIIFVLLSTRKLSKPIESYAAREDWQMISADSSSQINEILEGNKNISIAVVERQYCGGDFSIISRAKQHNPDLLVILVANSWSLREIRTAMNRGAFDILLSTVDLLSLTSTLKRAAKKAKTRKEVQAIRTRLQRFQMELEVASQIQKHVLPPAESSLQGCEISASMIPAREIGGDFYDYFIIDDHKIGIVIGDVSGKGIPAALFMAVCRSLLKATALQGWSACECLTHVNKILSEDNPSAMFVTIFYGILHTEEKRLDYSIGGHDSPLLIRSGGDVSSLERTANMVLGFDSEVMYSQKSVFLQKGDKIFLFTDGITEAENPARLLFGHDRLIKSLKNLKDKTTANIINGIIKDIKLFSLGTEQSDDITAMTLKI